MAKEWSKSVKIKEGALTAQGWPGPVRVGDVGYATTIRRLNYLANVTGDTATKAKARAEIARLQRKHGKAPKPPPAPRNRR